jgi:NAD(P)-dependent dehydrogenase (short-subunit alcohol dehydrogenase family)
MVDTALDPRRQLDKDRHAGKVALVTGAASGIGHAVAVRLAREGAAVACLDLQEAGAARTAAEITGASDARALGLCADVSDRTQVREAIRRAVDGFGGLDLLVNSAGIITMTAFEDLTDEEWDRVLDVNLKGCFIVAQEASRALSRGGAIVNISTVEADRVVSSSGHCQVHYNASKGGVKMLTKALAAELAEREVRVNAVAPGPVDTPLTGMDLHAPEVFAFMTEHLLIKRVALPGDIAAAVSFLLSDDASYITGVHLPVDGGWMVR